MAEYTDQVAGVSDPAFPLVVNSKLDATADPTVNDDSADGYSVGSLWVNVTLGRAWLLTDASVGSAVWVSVTASNMLLKDTEGQEISGGASVVSKSLGTIASGTVTVDPSARPVQHYTNNGAHTLAPHGTKKGACYVDITNGASAGAVTVSGWTRVDGDPLTTTNGDKFRCSVSIGQAGSLLVVEAMQ